ncbi:hypothetical protein BGZ99_001579, partial [Dissophora globulifera]
ISMLFTLATRHISGPVVDGVASHWTRSTSAGMPDPLYELPYAVNGAVELFKPPKRSTHVSSSGNSNSKTVKSCNGAD